MQTNTKFEYIFTSVPPLSAKSEEAIRRRMKNGEFISEQSTFLVEESNQQMCGLYAKDTIVKNCILYNPSDINNFKFYREILTSKQREAMKMAPRLEYTNKSLMYLSNPYDAQLNQVKLYNDKKNVSRCKIKDLFCVFDKGLALRCSIDLIDRGDHLADVSYESIFEFPQLINYLAETEPEMKQAAMYLGPTHSRFSNTYVNKFFSETARVKNNLFHVKILDFFNDRYYVDLIDQDGISFLSLIKKKFEIFREFCETLELSVSTPNQESFPFQPVYQMRFPKSKELIDRLINVKFSDRVLGGTSDYIRLALQKNLEAMDKSYIAKRFFRVRLVRWSDPDSVSFLPDDSNFFHSRKCFVQQLEELPCIKHAQNCTHLMNEPFFKGELVLFRNESDDYSLGVWLRGIVEHAPSYNIHNLSVGTTSPNYSNKNNNNFRHVKQLIRDGFIAMEDIYYCVRSIDYGFRCSSSYYKMRHVQNLKEFKRYGPWIMRCRLFGIQPLEMDAECQRSGGRFSTTCSEIISVWVRRRLSIREGPNFYILLREELNDEAMDRQFTEPIAISLFYRYEPTNTVEDAPKLWYRKTKFECLNTFLVDQGYVTDTLPDGQSSSNILLDEYIVNALASSNRL